MKPLSCPLCHRQNPSFWFALRPPTNAPSPRTDVVRCDGCGLALLTPQPDDATLNDIYNDSYFIGSDAERMRAEANALKRATAKLQLAEIAQALASGRAHTAPPQMLEIGCGLGNFLLEAQNAGFEVHGIDVSESAVKAANNALREHRMPMEGETEQDQAHVRAGVLEHMDLTPNAFDVVVLADVLEHVRDPKAFMRRVHTVLKPGGLIFLTVPSLDSLSARLMGRFWVEFKLEHLFYFDRRTLTRTLRESGYDEIAISPGYKVLSLAYIIAHFEQFPLPVLTPLMRWVGRILPRRIASKPLRIVASGINVTARTPGAKGP